MNKTKLISLLPILICIILVSYGYTQNQNFQNQLSQSQKNYDDLKASSEASIADLKAKIDTLQAEKETLSDKSKDLEIALAELSNKIPVIDEWELYELERDGITDTSIIINDLLSKPELIPDKAVLGGTMFFTSADIINNRWVYARYEDGHIIGAGIFEYQINKDLSIKWRVAKSFLY